MDPGPIQYISQVGVWWLVAVSPGGASDGGVGARAVGAHHSAGTIPRSATRVLVARSYRGCRCAPRSVASITGGRSGRTGTAGAHDSAGTVFRVAASVLIARSHSRPRCATRRVSCFTGGSTTCRLRRGNTNQSGSRNGNESFVHDSLY